MKSRCPACGRRERRSTGQNRRYFKLVALVAEKMVRPDGREFTVPQWHEWIKRRFMGSVEMELPDGTLLTIPNSTADEDTPEFSDFMTAFEAWAAERGVWLED